MTLRTSSANWANPATLLTVPPVATGGRSPKSTRSRM